jgi:hypothetical protein
MSLAFSLGETTHIVFCGQLHQLSYFHLSVQERETFYFFCVWQHLFSILELSDQERETRNFCFMQQYYSSQIGLCLQMKKILISFYVHQH